MRPEAGGEADLRLTILGGKYRRGKVCGEMWGLVGADAAGKENNVVGEEAFLMRVLIARFLTVHKREKTFVFSPRASSSPNKIARRNARELTRRAR